VPLLLGAVSDEGGWERPLVMVVMRRRCMGVVDDGGGSGRPVLFVDGTQIERRQTPTLDLGVVRHCKL
jgi:hypothetical protein